MQHIQTPVNAYNDLKAGGNVVLNHTNNNIKLILHDQTSFPSPSNDNFKSQYLVFL